MRAGALLSSVKYIAIASRGPWNQFSIKCLWLVRGKIENSPSSDGFFSFQQTSLNQSLFASASRIVVEFLNFSRFRARKNCHEYFSKQLFTPSLPPSKNYASWQYEFLLSCIYHSNTKYCRRRIKEIGIYLQKYQHFRESCIRRLVL